MLLLPGLPSPVANVVPPEFKTAFFQGAVRFQPGASLSGSSALDTTFTKGVVSFWFANNRPDDSGNADNWAEITILWQIDPNAGGSGLDIWQWFPQGGTGLRFNVTVQAPHTPSVPPYSAPQLLSYLNANLTVQRSISNQDGTIVFNFPARQGSNWWIKDDNGFGLVHTSRWQFFGDGTPTFTPNLTDDGGFDDSKYRFNIFQQGNNAAPVGILEAVGSVCLSLLGPASLSRPNNLRLVLFDQNGTQLVDVNADMSMEDPATWRQVTVSFDASVPRVQMTVDREIILDSSTGTSGIIEDLVPTTWEMHAPLSQAIDVAYFYYGVGGPFYDLSVSDNLDQFINSDLVAVNFGKSGGNVKGLTCGIMHTGNATNILTLEDVVNFQFPYNAANGATWGGTIGNAPTAPPIAF